MLARTHFIRIQRTIYDRLKGHARQFLGGLSPELKKYFLEYQRDFQNFEGISSKKALVLALQKTNIVCCGDYHTLAQAQRTVIRLLREVRPRLVQEKRKLVLALEMVRYRDRRAIERYLGSEISEGEFLEAISFQRNWGFSWDNYRELFRFAKEHHIEVVGLNDSRREPSLAKRDRFAARVISQISQREERAFIFVLIGDLHLAQAHLPKAITQELRKLGLRRRTMIIHQNHERFYWKLVDKGLEHKVDVVKIRDNVFCVMNTPPWVKLQSHLKWAELVFDDDAPPEILFGKGKRVQVVSSRYGEEINNIDYNDEIRELMDVIKKSVGIEKKMDDNFKIYGPIDVSFLQRFREEKKYSERELRLIGQYARNFKSHFIPGGNVIFLTGLSINQVAAQTAILIHSQLSGFRRIFKHPPTDAYSFIWVEALGFLGSKLINPKRKCNGPKDLQHFLRESTKQRKNKAVLQNRKVAEKALFHLECERRWLESGGNRAFHDSFSRGKWTESRILFQYKVCKVLGHLLGQGIFTALVEGKVGREAVRNLFSNPFSVRGNAGAKALYLKWIRRIDRFGYRSVVKAESL